MVHPLFFEPAHVVGLIPLIVLAGRLPPRFYVAGFAFASSWLADALHVLADGAPVALPYLPCVQFALFAIACGAGRWVFVVLAVATLLVGDAWGVSVTALGSAICLYHAHDDALAPVVWLYCGVGSVLYIALVGALGAERFVTLWYLYQAVRWAAVLVFLAAARQAAYPPRVRS